MRPNGLFSISGSSVCGIWWIDGVGKPFSSSEMGFRVGNPGYPWAAGMLMMIWQARAACGLFDRDMGGAVLAGWSSDH